MTTLQREGRMDAGSGVGRGGALRAPAVALNLALTGLSWTGSMIAAGVLALTVLMVLGNVIARAVFNRALWDHVQLGSAVVTVIAFTGVAWSYREGVQPRVTLVIDHLPRRIALLVQTSALIASLAVLAIIIRETAGYAAFAYKHGELIAGGHSVPAFLPQALIPLGLIAVFLEIVRGIIVDVLRFTGLLASAASTQPSVEPGD